MSEAPAAELLKQAQQQLKERPLPTYKRPAYPNYHKTGPAPTDGGSR